MLWTPNNQYELEPFEYEADLETAILEVKSALFGPNRVYLDIKRKIGAKGKTNNIPDAYLIDLTSHKKPMLYVVENELAKHEHLRHIAVQILEFSLSFEASPQRVKTILRNALEQEPSAKAKCQQYAEKNGFENIDFLLEQMIYRGGFSALVIIDELSDELETALVKRFSFGVDVLTLRRFLNTQGERIYEFEPFLQEVTGVPAMAGQIEKPFTPSVDFSDLDTIVVPAREEGFQEVAIGENRWHHIRIHGTMIPKIKYIAFYRTSPTSAITHIAPVMSIESWNDTDKYVLNFSEPVHEIRPLCLQSNGRIKSFQSPRYTAKDKLLSAKTLDDVF